MINVFKTNVYKKTDAKLLSQLLADRLPGALVNFDLQDIDKILRVQIEPADAALVVEILNEHGFHCFELDD